jgi:hypothetical protein
LKLLSCCVSPQQVGTGKPNIGVSYPSGMGAGVEWSVASFWASERPEEDVEEERDDRFRKSVARKAPVVSESLPLA